MISDTDKYKVPNRGSYNFKKIPLNDPRVFSAFSRGDTVGVFQLEKKLGQDWSKKLKPDNIDHIAALVALLRPACLESMMSESYCNRKNGLEEVQYFHPSLVDIFKNTYGTNVYQEQNIRIGMEIAGMTEEEADTYIRKGIGKKLPEVIAECKKRFLEGCKKVGKVNEAEAEEIFSWLEKAQRYQFNLSHSVEYAITAYQTMYAKVHFPLEFYCAWLNFADWKPDPKEEIYNLVQDAKRHNINVNPPIINRNKVNFSIEGNSSINFGIKYIKGVGEKAMEVIDKNKEKLNSFNDFLSISPKIHRNISESLIKAGACDIYKIERIYMLRQLWCLLGRSDKEQEDQISEIKKLTKNELDFVCKELEQNDLKTSLGLLFLSKKSTTKRKPVIASKIKWLENSKDLKDTNRQKAIWEKIYLGLNLTCSAADDFDKIEQNVISCNNTYLKKPKDKFILHVVIDKVDIRETGPKSKNPGAKYAYLAVSDNSGAINNAVIWPDLYEKIKDELIENTVICLYCRKDCWKDKDQVICENLIIIG